MAKKKNRKNSHSRQRRSFAYKHTVGAILAISAFVMLLDTAIIQALLNDIVRLGYLGIFLSGFISVSFFTAAPAVVLLLAFAHSYNPFIVAAIAGGGAMVGDFIIIKFVEDKIAHELKPVARRLKLISFINLLHKKRYKSITATLGAVLIATPLPDEAGIALLGLSHLSTLRLLGVTLILNCAGILALVMAFR